MIEYLENIATLFKNKTLNAFGVERDFLTLLSDGDVSRAIGMMSDYDSDVDQCIMEYYPEKHIVTARPNKIRENKTPYITEKLTRKRQAFINEVALFFLLNNKIKFICKSREQKDRDAYKIFCEFIEDSHFNTSMRQVKRLAGAETEAAKLYHIYRNEDDNNVQCRIVVLARSTGYKLRSLIDQYGEMKAFAYGYKTKENGRTVEHWDIQTKDWLFYTVKNQLGWNVETRPNPTGKINIVYYRQNKEWNGVQNLCDREESVQSRLADNNNYFSDPIAKVSADILMMQEDEPHSVGKMIQVQGDQSVLEYINPPQVAGGWTDEKNDLKSAILTDSFTPDFSYEGIKGYGTLTGAALRNAMTIGYIKRSLNLEVYEIGVAREVSVIKSFLAIVHPEYDWANLRIDFEFADPFTDDKQTLWSAIGQAKANGIISEQTAIEIANFTDDTDAELQRIKEAQREEMAMQAHDKGNGTPTGQGA